MSTHNRVGESQIVEKAKDLGASLAGITSVRLLQSSPSYAAHGSPPSYRGYRIEWPEKARSVLVLAVDHPRSQPELDWWGSEIPGRTPGNGRLMAIAKGMRLWLEELGIGARSLPYGVEAGGVFLKDAAVLAGLGVIGSSNLLITPELGPQVRLRAMFLDLDLTPTGPVDFDPCDGCAMPCRHSCPRDAFRNDRYEARLCDLEMKENEAHQVLVDAELVGTRSATRVIKYCRECELACPAGR